MVADLTHRHWENVRRLRQQTHAKHCVAPQRAAVASAGQRWRQRTVISRQARPLPGQRMADASLGASIRRRVADAHIIPRAQLLQRRLL